MNHSSFLIVEEHRVELPDGRIIDDWPWVITPSYANVVALTHQRRILCFRQIKYALKSTSLAPVAGYVEPGEDPLEAAQRELLEETGYSAEEWSSLGAYVVDANRGAGVAHLFLATGAAPVRAPNTDDLEEQELLTLTLDEFRAAVVGGEFKALSWAAIAAIALLQLSS